MALKKSIVTDALVSVENAYHRVEGIVHPTKDTMKFHLRSYVLKGFTDEEEVVNEQPHDLFFHEQVYACEFDINGSTAWIQAYTYLKSLPEFSDAVDC